MRFATQPTSGRPSLAIACAVSSAWLMHPSWIPTTITTGSCSCTTHSDSGRKSFIRLRQPPVPSTTT
jgi:hypothetical protein